VKGGIQAVVKKGASIFERNDVPNYRLGVGRKKTHHKKQRKEPTKNETKKKPPTQPKKKRKNKNPGGGGGGGGGGDREKPRLIGRSCTTAVKRQTNRAMMHTMELNTEKKKKTHHKENRRGGGGKAVYEFRAVMTARSQKKTGLSNR